MKKLLLKTDPTQNFFKRGKALARSADSGKPLPQQRTLSFEEPGDLVRLLTATRLDVFRAVKQQPG